MLVSWVELSHEELYWMKLITRNALLLPYRSSIDRGSHVSVSGPAL